MSHSNRQRRLFVNDGPAWWSLHVEQRSRIADLLAELFVAQLDRLHAVVSPVERESEDHRDG